MNAIKLLKSAIGWFKTPKTHEEQKPISLVAASSGNKDGLLNEYSDTWIYVSNWAEAELQRARERNDSHTRDPIKTAALRGRIETLKELLDMPRPKDRRGRTVEQE